MLRDRPVFPVGYGLQRSFDMLSTCQRASPDRGPPQPTNYALTPLTLQAKWLAGNGVSAKLRPSERNPIWRVWEWRQCMRSRLSNLREAMDE